MTRIKNLWTDTRSGILYLRRKVPVALRASFNCGEFYKVTLGTSDLRVAEKKFAIANGEYEAKLATFRAALAGGANGSLAPEEALALVERYLTARSSSGFATGGTQVAFILRDLDDAVRELSGLGLPNAQDMSAEEWRDHMSSVAGSDGDDEFSKETLARIEAAHAMRHAPLGQAWYDYQRQVPRRRWRSLLNEQVAAIKRKLDLPQGAVPGIDEPLIDALADALLSPEIRLQLPSGWRGRRLAPPWSSWRPIVPTGAVLMDRHAT